MVTDVPHFKVELIAEVLKEVKDTTERVVLRDYFGLGKRKPRTLAQIGKGMGVSSARIGQIKQAGVRNVIELLKAKGKI